MFHSLSNGRRESKFAAQTPKHISTITQKVGLNISSTNGVFSPDGAVYPYLYLPSGYVMHRKMRRRIPASVDLYNNMVVSGKQHPLSQRFEGVRVRGLQCSQEKGKTSSDLLAKRHL